MQQSEFNLDYTPTFCLWGSHVFRPMTYCATESQSYCSTECKQMRDHFLGPWIAKDILLWRKQGHDCVEIMKRLQINVYWLQRLLTDKHVQYKYGDGLWDKVADFTWLGEVYIGDPIPGSGWIYSKIGSGDSDKRIKALDLGRPGQTVKSFSRRIREGVPHKWVEHEIHTQLIRKGLQCPYGSKKNENFDIREPGIRFVVQEHIKAFSHY